MEVPGKEKVMALREHIMQEMTKLNLENEHFNVGARVKKKDNSLVGEITEWDGDTATVKTDEGEVHHIQGNILTKKDVPAPKEEATKMNTPDEWAKPKAHIPEDQHKSEEKSKEEKIKNLKEKLMKTVRETKALIVPKTATGTQVDQIVQQKMPAAKAGDTVDIIRK
jgi:alpha-acetolactate decarboxylase